MKSVICLFLVAVCAVALARPDDKYTDKYDNTNVDEILQNDRLLNKYCDCLLEKPHVNCPPDAIELKSHMREALENDCAKCSDKHRETIKKVIKFLINNKAEIWKLLCDKYDPDNKYSEKYNKQLKEIKS